MKKLFTLLLFLAFISCGPADPGPTTDNQNNQDQNENGQDSNDQNDADDSGDDGSDDTDPGDDGSDDTDPGDDTEGLQGIFVNGAHETTGTAAIVGTNLVLTGFETVAGPDLKVYLSTDTQASDYIRLGDLQAAHGDQTYALPDGNIDFTEYKYVLIWCEEFTVLFGYAELE